MKFALPRNLIICATTLLAVTDAFANRMETHVGDTVTCYIGEPMEKQEGICWVDVDWVDVDSNDPDGEYGDPEITVSGMPDWMKWYGQNVPKDASLKEQRIYDGNNPTETYWYPEEGDMFNPVVGTPNREGTWILKISARWTDGHVENRNIEICVYAAKDREFTAYYDETLGDTSEAWCMTHYPVVCAEVGKPLLNPHNGQEFVDVDFIDLDCREWARPSNAGDETVSLSGLPDWLRWDKGRSVRRSSRGGGGSIPTNDIWWYAMSGASYHPISGTPTQMGEWTVSITSSWRNGHSETVKVKIVVGPSTTPGVFLTFDANGGNVDETKREVFPGLAVGELPVPVREKYKFLGWYLAKDGGTQITATTKVTEDMTYYAHWQYVGDADDSTIVFETLASYGTNADGTFSLNLTELIGTTSALKLTVKGLPAGLKFDAKTGLISGKATKPGVCTVTLSATNATVKKAVETTFTITVPNLSCDALPNLKPETNYYNFEAGMAFVPDSVNCAAADKDWRVAASGLPTGLKFDAKTGVITGIATKPGTYTVTFTATKGKDKNVATITVNIAALPDTAVGTFNGFVKAEGGEENLGTFQLTATDAGKLTAKVTMAAGTYSFSGTCWDKVEGGFYSVALTGKKGETLTLALDSSAGWNADQLTGSFAAVSSKPPYQVVARKNAFGKMWYLSAAGNERDGWSLSYTENTKTAALTVTLNADGSTKIAGKLGTLSVSASGYADVTRLANGVIYADFAPVLSVKDDKATLKKTLSIRANLWFDRSNDHAEGVGSAKLVEEDR